MFVKEMTEQTAGEFVETETPSWAQIEAAIRRLDGETANLLTIAGEGQTHMAIGGGANGLYVSYTTSDNLSFKNLVDPGKSDDVVYLVVGDQMGDYPARQCVDLRIVIRAARPFAEHGTADGSVGWEDQ